MFQAKLEIGELAYLLHTLKAHQVIGVNNDQLFPANQEQTDELLRRGLASLKTHSWLIPDGRGFNMSNQLILVVSAMAQPEQVVVLSRYVGQTSRQVVTYYLVQNIVVEQIFTSDGYYLLTQIKDMSDVIERVGHALQIPLTNRIRESPIILNGVILNYAMKQAKSGDLSSLANVLIESNVNNSSAKHLAQIMKEWHLVGSVEAAVLSGEQLKIWHDMAIFQGPDNTMWAITQDKPVGYVVVHSIDAQEWKKLLYTVIKGMVGIS